MQAFKRLYQFNPTANTQRVVDVDQFGRECAPVMEWRPAKTRGSTTLTHSELWEEAVLLTTPTEPASRVEYNGIIEYSRKL